MADHRGARERQRSIGDARHGGRSQTPAVGFGVLVSGLRRRPPQIWRSKEGERHATWLELFFDLVFVFAVAELGRVLHDDTSPGGFLAFVLLSTPVWSTWTGFSYYADQFDTDDPAYQFNTFVAMFLSIALAVNVLDAIGAGASGFVATYVGLRVQLVVLYARARRAVPEAGPIALRYGGGFAIAIGVWLLSLLVPEPARYGVWAVAALIELGTWIVANVTTHAVPVQVSHMPERFGLFTIIVLGEAIVVVGAGVTEVPWQAPFVTAAVAGFLIAICLWWLYFEREDVTVIDRALAGGTRELARSHIYGYGHLPVAAAITAASVGIEFAIVGAHGPSLSSGERAALGGGVALFLLALSAVQWATPRSLPSVLIAVRCGAAAALVVVALLGGAVTPMIYIALAAIILLGVIGIEIVWMDRPAAAT